MDTQIYAVDAQRHCPQDTTSSMLTLSRGAEQHPSFGRRASRIDLSQIERTKFCVSETHVEIIIENVKPD